MNRSSNPAVTYRHTNPHTRLPKSTDFTSVCLCVISQKLMWLGLPNSTQKCFTMSSVGQKVNGQGHESQKHCYHESLHLRFIHETLGNIRHNTFTNAEQCPLSAMYCLSCSTDMLWKFGRKYGNKACRKSIKSPIPFSIWTTNRSRS